MNTTSLRLVAFILFALAAAIPARAAEQVLVDFGPGFDLGRVGTTDARVAHARGAEGDALRVAIGHAQRWPGIQFAAPAGHWDLGPYARLTMSVKNAGTKKISLACRVDNPGADGKKACVTGMIALEPGIQGTLTVTFKRTMDDKMGGKLFGLRGYPVRADDTIRFDPARVTQILVFANGKPEADGVFILGEIRASGDYVAPTAWTSDANPFFPFIDTFGQYKHKDWPGKTHSLAELVSARERETKELAAQPGPRDWDRFGGWAAGPQLKASGFFRTEKYQGKWWLVDPEGRLFFSHGVDCVGEMNRTPIDERQTWFEDFPGNQPPFNQFLGTAFALKGHYAGRSPMCFTFCLANLVRKYGTEWHPVYADVVHRRLRSWGLNTIANWSSPGITRMRRTPYTDSVSSKDTRRIEGGGGYWRKFPDVFDPSFEQAMRRSMAPKRGDSAGDPWCLGYFSDNEESWGDEASLALGALQSPPEQAAKRVLVADLKKKYVTIERLNKAWGSDYASWDGILQSRKAPDRGRAKDDLEAFYTKTAERYFRTVREAIKAIAPHQLYLGCRFAWGNPLAAAAAAKYCDVVSYNIYRRSVDDFVFNGGADVPLIIGEFHFGALDRGMFHTGLVPTANQAERAQTYINYVRGALRHPQFVGTGWFKFQDEPTTGRVYDEENYQIGFLDVADTPYPELVAASRAVAADLYPTRLKGGE